jgi:hypothetical protein
MESHEFESQNSPNSFTPSFGKGESYKNQFINYYIRNRKLHCLGKYDFINSETILTVNGYVIEFWPGGFGNYLYCTKENNYNVGLRNVNIHMKVSKDNVNNLNINNYLILMVRTQMN